MGKFIVGMAALMGASGAFAQAKGVPPGPPPVEVENVVDVNIVGADSSPIPVVTEQAASTPFFLSFSLQNPDWRSDTFTVPQGARLQISFVGAYVSGVSTDTRDITSAVHLSIRFIEGEGATCFEESGETCSLRVPVLQLNNSDVGANISAYFPSATGPASFELPAGATIQAELYPGVGGNPGPSAGVRVRVAGLLLDSAP